MTSIETTSRRGKLTLLAMRTGCAAAALCALQPWGTAAFAQETNPEVAAVQATGASDGAPVEQKETEPKNVDDDGNLEEIVVTAQKREQSLQDVPIAVTVFSKQDIERNRIEGLQDYTMLTPNVAAEQQGSRSRTQVFIRGVGVQGGVLNSLGIYVDEFNISPTQSIRTFDPNLFDIQRIEVLRGPQGTLFGRNVTAGAINITTVKPGNEFSGSLTADYGSFDSLGLRGAVNIPLVTDKAAVRITGLYSRSDGFLKNVGPSGEGDWTKNTGARAAFRLTPTPDLTIDLGLGYSKIKGGFNSLVPNGIDAAEDPDTGLPFTAGLDYFPRNRNRINTNDGFSSYNRQYIANGRIEYDFGPMSLVSVTGYMDLDHLEGGEFDYSPIDAFEAFNGTKLNNFSQEVRLQSSGKSNLSWVVGAMYAKDKFLTTLDFISNDDPVFGFPPLVIFDDVDVERFTSKALFGEATLTTLGGALDLTAGLRYSHDKVSSEFFYVDFEEPLVTGSDRAKFSDFSPKFAVSYRPSEDVSFYVTAAKGYRGGGTQPGLGPDFRYDEEIVWNYEAGAKTQLFDNRLRFNAALFQMNRKDIQVMAYDLSTGGLDFFTQNAAKARSRGFEIDMAARPIPALDLTATVGYLDSKFTSFPNAVVLGELTDITGQRVPGASKWTGSATGQYNVALNSTWDSFVRGEWAYRGNYYQSEGAGELKAYYVPSRSVFNFRAGLESDRYSLVGYVENAFKNKGIIGSRCLFIFYPGCLSAPDPRRFGVRGTVRF